MVCVCVENVCAHSFSDDEKVLPMALMSFLTRMMRIPFAIRKSAIVAAIIVVKIIAMWGIELYSPFWSESHGTAELPPNATLRVYAYLNSHTQNNIESQLWGL